MTEGEDDMTVLVLAEETVQYVMWKQRDGTKVRIVDMNDQHLFNAIRMCERRAEYLCGLQRGEHEDPVMEPEFFLHCRYDDLVFEARKRGIKLR